MSGIMNLLSTVGGSVAGSVGNQIGYGIGELTGYNESLRKNQLEQQQQLTDMQSKANLALMKESYKEQQNLWDETNAEAQIAHLERAGLNPALMYAKGGAGGSTGSGGASVGGGQASDEASRQNANTQNAMLGLAMMKVKSEIAVNESIAKKNVADATTSDESRSLLVEKLKQEGKSTWLDNIRQRYLMGETDAVYKNKQYGEASVSTGSLFDEQNTVIITKALADTNNAQAQALLTNEKAQGYWQELLNDTARADNDKIKATAIKLAAEWQTGEYTNWKTWADLARGVFKDVFQSIK